MLCGVTEKPLHHVIKMYVLFAWKSAFNYAASVLHYSAAIELALL